MRSTVKIVILYYLEKPCVWIRHGSASDRKLQKALHGIDVETRGHWGHVPPRFCNKQRSARSIFRKCPFFLKEKVPSMCRAPKFEMLPPSQLRSMIEKLQRFKSINYFTQKSPFLSEKAELKCSQLLSHSQTPKERPIDPFKGSHIRILNFPEQRSTQSNLWLQGVGRAEKPTF